jgi:hypothetical protein
MAAGQLAGLERDREHLALADPDLDAPTHQPGIERVVAAHNRIDEAYAFFCAAISSAPHKTWNRRQPAEAAARGNRGSGNDATARIAAIYSRGLVAARRGRGGDQLRRLCLR